MSVVVVGVKTVLSLLSETKDDVRPVILSDETVS